MHPAPPSARPPGRAHIIVVGNAKGGSGKSTTAMHVLTRLMAMGHRVAALDLDGQQQTLGRYVENRELFAARREVPLQMPTLTTLVERPGSTAKAGNDATYAAFCAALEAACLQHDTVVVDCPGADTFLSRLAHLVADTLITPLNDSFIDLDLLARIDPDTFAAHAPSWYSAMVWDLRVRRFVDDGHRLDWVVVRNRLAPHDARNKRAIAQVLARLAPTLAFRQVPGFGERVIFRELFLRGLTLSDLKLYKTGVAMTMNHVAAHAEIRALVTALKRTKRPARAQAELVSAGG